VRVSRQAKSSLSNSLDKSLGESLQELPPMSNRPATMLTFSRRKPVKKLSFIWKRDRKGNLQKGAVKPNAFSRRKPARKPRSSRKRNRKGEAECVRSAEKSLMFSRKRIGHYLRKRMSKQKRERGTKRKKRRGLKFPDRKKQSK
jgi:hypothetical protein